MSTNKEKLIKNNQDLNNIKTQVHNLPEYLDTSDATATASDMEQGKTAYVNGQKVTGTLITVYRTGSIAQSITSDNQGVGFVMKTYAKNIYNKNAEITVTAQKTELAPVIGATASKIKKDEVICGVTGTYEGTDTSDANATASDILDSKTAYVDGQKIQGLITVYDSGCIQALEVNVDEYIPNEGVFGNVLLGSSLEHGLYISPSDAMEVKMDEYPLRVALGVSAEKIKRGETILGVAGTCDGIDTSDATAIAGNIQTGKTAYVNGQKITGNIPTSASGSITFPANKVIVLPNNTLRGESGSIPNQLFKGGAAAITMPFGDVATAIGLTADVIKKDVTILGITGTYDGTEPAPTILIPPSAAVAFDWYTLGDLIEQQLTAEEKAKVIPTESSNTLFTLNLGVGDNNKVFGLMFDANYEPYIYCNGFLFPIDTHGYEFNASSTVQDLIDGLKHVQEYDFGICEGLINLTHYDNYNIILNLEDGTSKTITVGQEFIHFLNNPRVFNIKEGELAEFNLEVIKNALSQQLTTAEKAKNIIVDDCQDLSIAFGTAYAAEPSPFTNETAGISINYSSDAIEVCAAGEKYFSLTNACCIDIPQTLTAQGLIDLLDDFPASVTASAYFDVNIVLAQQIVSEDFVDGFTLFFEDGTSKFITIDEDIIL